MSSLQPVVPSDVADAATRSTSEGGPNHRSRRVRLGALRRFYGQRLPREYRASWPFLLAAAALFFVPFLGAAFAVASSPEASRLVLPESVLRQIQRGQTWFATNGAERAFLASYVMSNNLQIAFLALIGGLSCGVLTAAVLIDNGIYLGGVTGALAARGLGEQLIGFVSPHGFLEVSVVLVAGAGGLMIGKAIVWPGRQNRRDALIAAVQRSTWLILGMLPFLGLAGLLEGFVSPASFPWPFKLAIGLTSVVGLYGYLLFAGREKRFTREGWEATSPGHITS